jgi:hypothetical protein
MFKTYHIIKEVAEEEGEVVVLGAAAAAWESS